MNKERIQRFIGTIQFVLLSLIFVLPWLSGHTIQPVSMGSLNMLLEFEYGVLIFGFLISGLLFVPMALIDSPWLRRISLLLAFLMIWPLTRSFHHQFGWQGAAGFYWLLFVNYGGVFLHSMALYNRGKVLAEAGVRTLFYVVLFVTLIELLGLPNYIGRWPDKANSYLFGSLYFLILAFFEYKRYFTKSVNFIYHVLDVKFRRLPKRKVRYKNGNLQAHVVKYSRAHYWWLVLGVGVVLIGSLTPLLLAASNSDAPLAMKIVLWVFCIPFYLFGVAFILSGPWMMFKFLTAKPAWLKLNRDELEDYGKLLADGFVPSYTKEEKRHSIVPVIICFQFTPPAREDEFIQSETLLEQDVSDSLILIDSDRGTRFQIECALPEITDKSKPDGVVYVWHLQMNVTEKRLDKNPLNADSRGNRKDRFSRWSLAFTLPV